MNNRKNIKKIFGEITSNKLIILFLIGSFGLYIINFYPNTSTYFEIILDQLNGIFISGIFTILIVDKVVESNTKNEKRTALVIMQKSIVSCLAIIIKTFQESYLSFAVNCYYDDIDGMTTNIIRINNEEYDTYIDSIDTKEEEKEYLAYLKRLTGLLGIDDIDKYFPSFRYSSDFFKNFKMFHEKTNPYFDVYRNLWVERFLIFAGDESEKINLIIDLDTHIFEYQRMATIFLRKEYQKYNEEKISELSFQEQDEIESTELTIEEAERLFKAQTYIGESDIIKKLIQIVDLIYQLTNLLYKDMELI